MMPKRYLFFAGSFILTLLLYIDRVVISSAKESISNDLSLSDTQMGWVLASFALGYALFQVPAGAMGDKYGPRKVLTVIIGFWSLMTALTGMAWNFASMLVCRFVFGAGEAGAFPNISRAAFSWVPMKERGFFQGINFAGSRLGAAFALPLVAWLIEIWGWKSTFLIFGAIGLLFAVVYFVVFRDKPEDHPGLSDEEKTFILENRQKVETSNLEESKLPASILFKSKNVLGVMGQYVASNFIFFFMLTWLFPYVKEKYELSMVTAGFYSMFPLIAGAFGNLFSGYLVDKIYKGGNWQLSRKLPAILGFALVAIGIMASLYMDTVGGAIAFLSLAIFGADMTLSPSWSFCMDIGKQHAGKVSGLMNMTGNLGSFTTALAFPYLQRWTGSNDLFFYVAAILSVIAIYLWSIMDASKKLVD